MTTIAWDGKTLAADRRGNRDGLNTTVTKIFRLPNGEVLAFSGAASYALTMKRWYLDGANPDTYPSFNTDKEGCQAVMVVGSEGSVRVYYETPDPVPCEDAFSAWGSGRDFAIGAMACGLTAAEAVRVASRFDMATNAEVDSFDLQPILALVRGG